MSPSSIAAPAPPVVLTPEARWRTAGLPLAATLVAMALATLAWVYGFHPIRYDAQGYYDLAVRIAGVEPGGFANTYRTYGYPAFLSVLVRIVGPQQERLQLAAFVVQLAVYLGVAWIAAPRVSAALGMPGRAAWVYAVVACNPIMLIHSVQLLTDVFSATLVYLTVALSLPRRSQESGVRSQETEARSQEGMALPSPPPLPAAGEGEPRGSASPLLRSGGGVGRWGAWNVVLLGGLAMLVAGYAVMVRPSNLLLLPVLLLWWGVRAAWHKDLPWRAWPALLVLAILPFVPQVLSNYWAYGIPHPLVLYDLWGLNTGIGMRSAKVATLVMTGMPSTLDYANPFLPAEEMTPAEFPVREPLRYLGTLAVHAFALFDHDYPFTYIRDVTPWYRWPLAIPNFLYLLGGLAGLVLGLRVPPGETPRERSTVRLTLWLLVFSIGALVAINLPIGVENRYSLPVYPLLAGPFILALDRARVATVGRPSRLGMVVLGAAAWLVVMCGLSVWVERQATMLPAIRAAIANPPKTPSARYQVTIPEEWEAGASVPLPITVTNTGQDTWSSQGIYPVAVRAQFVARNSQQHAQLPPGARTYVDLPESIGPGQSTTVTATLRVPTLTGRYGMKVTVIRHGIDEETEPDVERQVRVERRR